MVRGRFCPLACALVAAALSATAISQQTIDPQTQEQQQQPNIAQVQAYELTHVPGCTVAEDDRYELPAGLFNECSIRMTGLLQNDPQLFVFKITANTQMSAVFTMMVQGGAASMSIWYPGSPVDGPPDLVQNELFSSAASSEAWISIPQEDLATHPGDYMLLVTASSGMPDLSLTVTTPPSALRLIDEERALLASVAGHCCSGNETMDDSPFCAAIAKKSLAPDHSWFEDMCHLAPSSCNPDGQLIKLALPGEGLQCESFPSEIGGLKALTRLDLSGNKLASATVEDVAKVVAGLPDLRDLALGGVGLSGELSCDLLTPNMKVLDLAYNLVEGSLPSCMVNNLTELYVPGNAITGTLPAPAVTSRLTTLYANIQRGGGLTGTIPVAYGRLRRIKFINVGGNSLSGALPGMPRTVKLLNVSDNNLSGRIGSLPAAVWNVDVSGNDLTGPLPALATLMYLEQFVANANNFEGGIPALPSGLKHLEASGCGLSGPLPDLPARLTRIDVADNQLTGSVTNINVTSMEVFRASNNSLTGAVPASAADSPALFLLDLGSNRLTGSLPDDWTAPRMQMIMLDNNAITGTIPSSLASLPRLGVLRLASNKLSGDLKAFAAQLTDPATTATDSSTKKYSNVFDFNVSANHLSGPVPDSLAWLGVFNPNITIIVPGAHGGPSIAPRVLDLSINELDGAWPVWMLDAVPSTTSICQCSIFIALSGPNMHLTCPPGNIVVSDYAWQLAAQQRYTCYNTTESQPNKLLDQLTSAANSNDKIDTTSRARGDGGNYPFTQVHRKPDPKVVAGAVVGIIVGLTLLGVVGYFLVYKRVIRPHAKAMAFNKFQDDPVAAATSKDISMTGLPIDPAANGVTGAAVHSKPTAARPL